MIAEDIFQQTFRKIGLRLTKQRKAIFEYLLNNHTHPTAQEIFSNLHPIYPELSLATVYNTLGVMVKQSLIQNLGSAFDESVHYDADQSPHINLICTLCHKISDYPTESINQLTMQIRSTLGFRVSGARIVYYGKCQTCLKKNI